MLCGHLEWWDGCVLGGRAVEEVQDGVDICKHTADPLPCRAEINTIL